MEFVCATEAETADLGRKIALIAQKGDVFALFGTLGMGKSVFCRAFVKKLCEVEEVPSPTFTLVQSYQAQNFEIWHFDLYRIKSPEEIFELGMEEAMYSHVCLIEWPEKMQGYLPRDVFKITITPFGSGRKIVVETSDMDKKQRLSAIEK